MTLIIHKVDYLSWFRVVSNFQIMILSLRILSRPSGAKV